MWLKRTEVTSSLFFFLSYKIKFVAVYPRSDLSQRVQRVLHGFIEEQCPVNTRTFRIFLSSTFTGEWYMSVIFKLPSRLLTSPADIVWRWRKQEICSLHSMHKTTWNNSWDGIHSSIVQICVIMIMAIKVVAQKYQGWIQVGRIGWLTTPHFGSFFFLMAKWQP